MHKSDLHPQSSSGLNKNQQSHPNDYQVKYRWQDLEWRNVLFLTITPFVCLVATPIYLSYFEWQWKFLFVGVIFYYLTSMSITAGYHRLLAHRAYEAPEWMRCLFLLLSWAFPIMYAIQKSIHFAHRT